MWKLLRLHKLANDHEIEFVSRVGNRFRIKWKCQIGKYEVDTIPVLIDADIEFKNVFVSNRSGNISLQAATKAVAEFFDINDFTDPYFDGRSDAFIVFELRPPSESIFE